MRQFHFDFAYAMFCNSKNLNCIGALSFFKICSHIFIIFVSQIGVVILVLFYWKWSENTSGFAA